MDYQTIIETFFSMLGRFDFDKAKSYIESRKEILQKLAPTFPNHLQLMTMLTTFSHLAEVEKNYHNQPFLNQTHHSFLPGASFLRKARTLKDMYNDIYTELQQLEQMESGSSSSNPEKQKNDNNSIFTRSPIPTAIEATLSLEPALKILPGKQSGDNQGDDQQTSNSSSTERDSPVTQVPQSPGAAFRNSFFRVLSPISSSASIIQSASFSSNNPYTLSSNSGYEPPPNSTTTTPVAPASINIRELSEELISHFCRQLQTFIQARLDLIDVYEKLTEATSKRYSSVDGIAFRLSMLCRQYHKYFHHPLLAPIKEGMTLECESLMTLIRATIDMQHWRFLPTLYDLQDAQSKLSYWAASTFNKEASKRRFKVSKTQVAPRLYEWLCKFKEFLVAKFTLYFHATLSKSFPQANFKSACSKLSCDYYTKLAVFYRKIDALFIALMYDVSSEKDFRGLGYNFSSRDYQQPQGKNTLQPMVVIPAEGRAKLNSLQAEIYMIVMTNQQVVMKEGHYQFHDNIKKLTYSVTKPDSNVVLVIVCEGQKADRDTYMRSFSLEITNQFAFLNIFPN